MLHFKSLLLGILPFLTLIIETRATPALRKTSEEPSYWNKDKIQTLVDTVRKTLKYTENNVTLVAAQDIYNEDGSLKDIRTIELTIPNLFEAEYRTKSDDLEKLIEYDDDFNDILVKVQNDFKKIYKDTGYKHGMGYQKLLTDGTVDAEIYVNKYEAYVLDEDKMGYYLRDNIRRTDRKKFEEEIKHYSKYLPNTTITSVLVWDADGKFLSDQSKVKPILLGYVDEASDDVDEKMMDNALDALSKYALSDPKRIAKELSAAMSNAHPEYSWIVTKWQDDNVGNAKHDVYIKLTYDNVMPGEPPVEHTLYGVKK